MHGIVDPDTEGGNQTTELPVAFRLRTAYKLRCGKDLHLMVGLGKDISVKFILGNPWLKSIGAVVGYGQHFLRAPLYPDMKKLPLDYKKPERGSAPVGHDSVAIHQAVFANMPKMGPFVKVLNAYSKGCPYLDYANQLVNTLQRGLMNDKIPARICATAAHGTGDGDDKNPFSSVPLVPMML